MNQLWWQNAVFYQIYPRSFADSNGDGIGDLDGITAHLDYLNDGTERSLGVDALWLSPIFPSPMRDFGYDVSDYCGIHPDFGDLASFDRMLAEAHRRGIRVILDLVPNHTSDQHPWFVASRASRTSERRNWYIWVPGSPDRMPNKWLSAFGGPAWEYDRATRAWYMHSFLKEQPDLNYRDPEVVEAMHDSMRFWLDRGVDGFRVDAISHLMKDLERRDNPSRRDRDPATRRDPLGAQLHIHDQNLAETHDVIRGFRTVTNGYAGRMMVGEVWPREQRELALYLRPDELHLAFNFRFLRCPWDANAFRSVVEEAEALLEERAWPTWTLSNHDFSRHISRYGSGKDTEARARVAATMMLTLRGTPFLYYGEEIGMRDVEIPSERKRDPVSRDRCRTPMQWSAGPGAGFTSGQPWLPIGDAAAANVQSQMQRSGSLLDFYRRIVWLRKKTPALTQGRLRICSPPPADCLAYYRQTRSQRLLVALNFAPEAREVPSPPGRLLFSTRLERPLAAVGSVLRMAGNEAAIVELAP